jgi:hypothetical protein
MNQFEIKTSKVKTAQYDGKWQDLHKYTIAFENGDHGTYFSKSDSQEKFKAGIETEYKYDELKNRIKVHYAEPFAKTSGTPTQTNDREIYIIRQSSLKAALEYHASVGRMEEQLLDTADMFTDYVLTGKKPQTAKNDNLPF